MVHHNSKHHKSPVMHFLGFIACLISAIGAINWGLKPFNYDLLSYLPANFVTYAYYIIGAAGAISIIMLLMAMAHHNDCKC